MALIRTLKQLATSEALVQPLNASASTEYLLYNDQPDSSAPSASYGHTKGVLASDSSKGIW